MVASTPGIDLMVPCGEEAGLTSEPVCM